MRRLALIFSLFAAAAFGQQHGTNFVSVMYDRQGGVLYPAAIEFRLFSAEQAIAGMSDVMAHLDYLPATADDSDPAAPYYAVGGDVRFSGPVQMSSLTMAGKTITELPVSWTPSHRIVTEANDFVRSDDYLIWMDGTGLASSGVQVLDLPDLDVDCLSVVVRHIGNDTTAILRRATETSTNTYLLAGDGASVAIDWLGAKNTWYWRQAY